MRLLYRLIVYLLASLLAGAMLWKGLRERGYWQDFAERFGFGPGIAADASIWVHAVSLGEVQAAAPLVRALRERHPELPLVLTTVTPAGAAHARALFGPQVLVRFLPFDLPGSVRRFLGRVRPCLAIVLETELWPNLYRGCAARAVPLLLASARISPRSLGRYRMLGSLIREILAGEVVIAAQSEADAERFIALGAYPGRTHVVGNLKFDFALPADIDARAAALLTAFGGERAVWVAGSTHPGEEQILLAVQRRLRAELPGALLVLAPRHPNRFAELAAWLGREQVAFVSRSGGAPCAAGTEVLLLDTLGELLAGYAAADVAFVAGSLVPVGGHNLLEPAALARPVLTGPSNFNAPQVLALLLECGGVQVVADADELLRALLALLRDPAGRALMGERARAVLEANRGALGRVLALALPLVRAASSAPRGRASR